MKLKRRRLSPDDLVATTARGITRRRVLRNAGGFALGAAVTTAYIGGGSEVLAQCTSASPCGPSPLCGPSRCSGFHCVPSSVTKWAVWGSGPQPCDNGGSRNCWASPCTNHRIYSCCDCCAHNPTCTTGASCTGCGSSGWRKCICRQATGTC